MFDQTFFRFFFTFVVIIALAFGVLIVAGSKLDQQPRPIDNIAVPQ